MKRKPKRRWHRVGVAKWYFPRDRWPAERLTSFFEIVEVLAKNRTDAATIAWHLHGDRWLAQMNANVRRVCLDVDEPATKVFIGRLIPIEVPLTIPSHHH